MTTPIEILQSALAARTGKWTGANWTHPYTLDADRPDDVGQVHLVDGEPLLCSGQGDCHTCATARVAAAYAEDHAQCAVQLAAAGNMDEALKEAERAATLERAYGDAPTWEPLVSLIEAAVKGAEGGEEDVDGVAEEQGVAVVVGTLAGHIGWDEGAMNAGVAQLVGVRGEAEEEIYYAAYALAATARAKEYAADVQASAE